jgi:hypothetical protein
VLMNFLNSNVCVKGEWSIALVEVINESAQ